MENIEYIYSQYGDRLYLGVGLIYNKELISLDEIVDAGRKIVSMDPIYKLLFSITSQHSGEGISWD